MTLIKLQGKLPRKISVAVSGGVDSMVALDFLKRNHVVKVLHYNHGTAHSTEAQAFVERYCNDNGIKIKIGGTTQSPPLGRSRECWWREQRYAFFNKHNDSPLITAHTLDDCVETWIFSSLNGTGKIVPYRRNHVVRPFRKTRKRDLELWANLNNVPYITDPSNSDIGFSRNYIRHELMPHALKVNPGLYKMISKRVAEDENRMEQ
jgi:tRNA(Ile)-lysidine synthase